MNEAAMEAVRAWLDAYAGAATPIPALAERGAVHLAAAGLPGGVPESWRYTDPGELLARRFAVEAAPVEAPVDNDDLPQLAGALRRVWVGGRPVPMQALGEMASGARLWALETAPEGVGAQLAPERNGFAALNALGFRHGAGLALDAGAVLAEPVHLLWWSPAEQPAVAAHPRVTIQLGAQAAATVVIHQAGAPEAGGFLNSAIEIALEAGAVLKLVVVDQSGAGAFGLSQVVARCARDSRLDVWLIDAGAGWVRRELDIALAEPGATVNLHGLVQGRRALRVDNEIVIRHEAPHTHSRQQTRAVLEDRARAVFGGGVAVASGAQGITARQGNATLLLSRRAEVVTRPALEILADDVQCSHGASVGQLDDAALFYLRSRGLDREAARALLIASFARAALPDVPVAGVLDWVFDGVEASLPVAATA
ncbi:MAG: Fe-S cluster assembly protein SufD [Pseudomonadota bacterium]